MLNQVATTLNGVRWTNWGELEANGPVVALTDDGAVFIDVDGSTRAATTGEVYCMLEGQKD